MSVTSGKPLSAASYQPIFREGNPSRAGLQHALTVALGTPTLTNGTTYRGVVFTAPCDGVYINELWVTSGSAMAGGTNTFAVDNYDKSAATARNVLSASTVDPTSFTTKQGVKLTLSSTESNLWMDEGDVLNFSLVCGTMSASGAGLALTAILNIPDLT